MDIDGILDDSTISGGELVITPAIRDFLTQTARWGRFLAIVGFVFTGLFLLGLLIGGSAMTDVYAQVPGMGGAGSFILVIYFIMLGIMIVPLFYLYNFSTKMKTALLNDNQTVLNDAFENQKSLYKFYGVFMAIMLGIYALIFVFAILGGLGAALMG